MGSIGANKNTATVKSAESFVGKSVQDIYDAVKGYQSGDKWVSAVERIREEFNLPNATTAQLNTVRDILQGMAQYDRGLDDNKTPYNIVSITIEEIGSHKTPEEIEFDKRLGIRQLKNPLYLHIRTVPNTDSAYLRMVDEKTHSTLIGPNGGTYEYNSKHKKKSLDKWNVMYGERTGIL